MKNAHDLRRQQIELASEAAEKNLDDAQRHVRVLATAPDRPVTCDDLARHGNIIISCTKALIAAMGLMSA